VNKQSYLNTRSFTHILSHISAPHLYLFTSRHSIVIKSADNLQYDTQGPYKMQHLSLPTHG